MSLGVVGAMEAASLENARGGGKEGEGRRGRGRERVIERE